MKTPTKYHLTIAPTSNVRPSVFVQLRRLLKLLLRGYGFRCLSITAEPPAVAPPDAPAARPDKGGSC